MSRRIGSLLVAAALAAAAAVPAAAQTGNITVVVDGQAIAFDVPPVQIAGRVLVPLRGVFEKLGAFVDWNAATGTVTAVREGTTIELRIGSRQAFVSGRPVTLDVPPMIVRGRTMVPLRFVGEALGAQVDWDAATRTVFILSPGAQPAPRPVPPPQPPIPPPPQQTTIEGVLLRVDLDRGRILVQRGDVITQIQVTSGTAITRVESRTNTGGSVSLGQLEPGDQVRVTVDPSNVALVIRATTLIVTGRVDAITSRVIVLADGNAYNFNENVRFTVGGQPVGRDQIRPGMQVQLRLNPDTREVWEVSAGAVQPPAPPPPAARPVIDSFTVDARDALRAGDVLTVTLRGTAGGRATFDVSGLVQDVVMTERRPGEYVGAYTVRAGDNVTAAPVFGHLRVGGAEAPLVQAGNPVTIDTADPVFLALVPGNAARINNNRPNIVASYDDRGSGINTASVRIIVAGRDVIRDAVVTATAVSYNPPQPFADGDVQVSVRVSDRAGNTAEAVWRFTVDTRGSAAIQSVTVGPARALQVGDVLTVAMTGDRGGRATFSIEGIVQDVAMAEQTPGQYVGTYTVRSGDNARDARVIVQLVTRAGQVFHAEATARVTIVTSRPAAPVITGPQAGSRVASPLRIQGTGTPGMRVEIEVRYETAIGPITLTGLLARARDVVDANGQWSVAIRYSGLLPGSRIIITAVTVSPTGERSQAATIEVVQQ